MKAILVAIKLKNNKYFDDMVLECQNLCDAAGYEVIETITQSSNSLEPNYALRSGKLEELSLKLEETGCKLVIFYNNISKGIVSNLKDYLRVDVIDRTGLILDIFALRARSKEAQIQTEMARLKYKLPQLLKDNMDSDKQRGGTFNNRGAGETRGVIIRRNIESRINELKNELKDLEKRKDHEYLNRSKSELKKVALVGYTNAGKSSLMNALLKRNENEEKLVLEKDQLFATLDTSVRNIKFKKHEFLLSDTVGFVSDLPHGLVEAFKSTLKSAVYADLLIHVIDLSNPNYQLQSKVTLDTLKQIGADQIKMINVYNKCDLVDPSEYPNELCISCKENIGIEELLEKIDEIINPIEETIQIRIPYDKLAVVEKFKAFLYFELIDNDEKGSLFNISGEKININKFKKYIKDFY